MISKQNEKPVLVRMPESMLSRIGQEARKSGRSRNAEIVQRLEKSLTKSMQK